MAQPDPRPALTYWLDNTCPHCGYRTTKASLECGPVSSPTPGAVSLCLRCGEWSIFDQQLKLRKPTDDEFMEIAEDEDLRRLRMAWVALDQERKSS
jgi:hypothetical protein